MMESPSTEAVLKEVYALYNNPDSTEKEKASKWLEQFQKSIHSWKIANQLLQDKYDMHSCYFAAQTMRSKIQNSFHELPATAHESLRNSLLEHISHITNDTNQIIVTQLCLALADLSLLMASWQKPIPDLLELFSAKPNSMNALIVILTFIPEEINSRYLRLGANRREEILMELRSNSATVAEFLQCCLQNYGQTNETVQMKIVKCFTSWISVDAIKLKDVTENMILSYSFSMLINQHCDTRIHDIASDCLCAVIQCSESGNSVDLETEKKIFNGIAALEEAYHISVAHEDLNKSINFCRIFTVLAEAFLNHMLDSNKSEPHYSIKALDLVLNCVGHYDFEVAEISFSMWYKLSEELYHKNSDTLTAIFKPYVERLIVAVYKHCQMEPDHEGLIEDQDVFQDFRFKVSELIKDVIFISSSSNCFKQMFMILKTPSVTWESSEAALFIMENVARNILPEENEIVPQVVQAIIDLPENCHIAIRFTSINILGELCDWIDCHPETLESVLNYLLCALQAKHGLAAAAANALNSICASCKIHMTSQISGLLEIARCLDSFEIPNDSAINLLKGISTIVSRLPNDQVPGRMKDLCDFQLAPLHQLVVSKTKIEYGKRSDPSFWLDRLASIYRYVTPAVNENDPHPCAAVIIDNWMVLSLTMDTHQHDGKVMERVVRCVRYAVRSIGKQAIPILESLVTQIITVYATDQHSCLLYLGSILVDEFAKEPSCNQGLLKMLQAFIEPTFKVLQQENGLKNHPDTVDDFFRLSSRFMQRLPLEFLESQLVTPILQCALLACTLDHKDANASVMKFFCNLISSGKPGRTDIVVCGLVQKIILENAQPLVSNLIYASVFSLHSYMISDVVDVFVELKHLCPGEGLRPYVKHAVEVLPRLNSGGCQTATDQQLSEFIENVLCAESGRQMTQVFQNFIRLYR